MKTADWHSQYGAASLVLCLAHMAIVRHLNGGQVLGPLEHYRQARAIIDEAMPWLHGLQPAFTGERLQNGSLKGDRAAEAHNRPLIRAHMHELCSAMGSDCVSHFDRLVSHN